MNFIELTSRNNKKVLINLNNVTEVVERSYSDTTIHYDGAEKREVKETYEEVKDKILNIQKIKEIQKGYF